MIISKLSRLLLYSTAVMPIVLWSGFTFPFVTIRTIMFRVIIEIVVVLTLLLWVKGKYSFQNFKKQYFFWIFLSLLVVESLVALFGESILASFFGDLERMWGIYTVMHIFLLYVLVRIHFTKENFKTFLHVSLVTSIIVSVFGILQRYPSILNIPLFGSGEGTRVISTLGNPVYVAIYLLFNISFVLLLLLKTQSNKFKYFYLFVIAINFYAFTLTDIRGAYLGLIIGVISAGLLYLFLGNKKRLKYGIGAGFVLGVIVISLGFQFKNLVVANKIPILHRVVTISINDETAKTRFIGWNAAIKGFAKDPLTGVGMENYNILFNEYFPARYYLLAPTETYFDRAHNQFFNILAESGVIALLLYLGFPVLIGFYLVHGYRIGRFSLNEFMLLCAMAIAYFVHLFFVFDDIHSLLFFVVFLALIEYQYRESSILTYEEQAVPCKTMWPVVASLVLIPIVLYSVYSLNFKILKASRDSSVGILVEDVAIALQHHRKAVSANLVPSENITLSYVEYLLGLTHANISEDIKSNSNTRQNILVAFFEAENELKKEITKKPNDAVFYLKIGQLNNSRFLLDSDILYLHNAIKNLERAIQLSPERIQIYLVLGETYVLAGENEKAVEILEQAVKLEPDFRATYYFLGRTYLTNNELDKAYDVIVNKGFIEYKHEPEDNSIAFVLAQELALAGEYEKMVITYEYLSKFEPNDARIHSALAVAYILSDRPLEAIKSAQKATELDPEFAVESDLFIKYIEEGRIEELKKFVF